MVTAAGNIGIYSSSPPLFQPLLLVSLCYVSLPTRPEAPLGQEMLSLFVYVHTPEKERGEARRGEETGEKKLGKSWERFD